MKFGSTAVNRVSTAFVNRFSRALLVALFWIPTLLAADAFVTNAQLKTGLDTSYLLKSDGTVWSWGKNDRGQLGLGSAGAAVNRPQQITGLSHVRTIVAGGFHAMALADDGRVWAWGANDLGQLGLADRNDRSAPQIIPTLSGIQAISAGFEHSLALQPDGSVWAWGFNQYGQLGLGHNFDQDVPQRIPAFWRVTAISGGFFQSFVLRSDGTTWAWGDNQFGQLGLGNNDDHNVPVLIPHFTGAVEISSGHLHTLARKADGSLWAWGYNGSGQLGTGNRTDQLSPTRLGFPTGVVAVNAGLDGSLVLTQTGDSYAFGFGGSGQLGLGDVLNSDTPVALTNMHEAVSLSGRYTHSLALTRDGAGWAWGANDSGQLASANAAQQNRPQIIAPDQQASSRMTPAFADFGHLQRGIASPEILHTLSASGGLNNLNFDTSALTQTGSLNLQWRNSDCQNGTLNGSCHFYLSVLAAGRVRDVSGVLSIPASNTFAGSIMVTAHAFADGPKLQPLTMNTGFSGIAVGGVREKNVSFGNAGSQALQINQISLPSGHFSLVADHCSGHILPARQQCTIRIAFSSTIPGQESADLTISSNDPVDPLYTMKLSATAF